MLGYDAAVLAGVQTTEAFQSAVGYPIRQSTSVMPMIASSYTLGAWVMAMAVSFIGSSLGRRRCILYGNVLCLIGGALQASSFGVPQLIIGRILVVRMS
jgi:MFS family permease